MKSILDIPDAAVLAVATLDDLVGEFCSRLKIEKPDAIALPIIDYGGACYPSSLVDRNQGPWSRLDILSLVEEIQHKHRCDFIASVLPAMPFLDVPSMQTRTQYGGEAAGPCLTNPAIQKLLRAALDEFFRLLDSKKLAMAGVMLDVVDIQGLHGRNGRISATCFCRHCTDALATLGRFDYQVFATSPSPLNVVLKDTSSGISNLTLDLPRQDPQHLVELSKERNIYDATLLGDDKKATQWAGTVLEYVEARSRVTAQALQSIGTGVRTKGIKFIITTGHATFDWTSGIDLWHITDKIADAVWLDTGELARTDIPPEVEIYHYLSARARYRIDAFFELVSDMDKLRAIAARFTDAKRSPLDEVRERSLQMMSVSQLRRANVTALELQELGNGYVGFPVSESLVRKITTTVERVINELVPAKPTTEEATARDIVLMLMNVAKSGRQIDMTVLTQIAQRLGLFEQEDE